MGTILAEYFEKAKEIDGLSSQIKLAMITKMSAAQATVAPDSPENVQLFETAMVQVKNSA